MRQARTSILLSTLFVFAGAAAQCGGSAVPRPPGTPLEIYDRAVSHFFRAPRDPEQAIRLLAGACEHIAERRAQSCYNWGLLLEMEKDEKGALAAYRRAVRLEPLGVYLAAVAALDDGARPANQRLAALQKAARFCEDKKSERALETLRAAAKADAKGWTRELVNQPLFRVCLGTLSAYKTFAAGLPATSDSLQQQHRAAMAKRDPFHDLWDLEARFAREESKSRHPVTSAWHRALRSAARGDGPGTGAALQSFLGALPSGGENKAKSRGMAKAAALVVQQTRLFAGVRTHPDVQRFLGAAL